MRGRLLIAVAAATGGVLGFALPAANGADAGGSARSDARSLAAANATLADRRQSTLLELYALESRRSRAEARVERLRARLAELRAARESARRRLGVARRTAAAAQRELGRQVTALYRHGEPDIVAILLGATSLDEAITGLEGLQRSVRQTDRVLDQALAARAQTLRLRRTLARRAAELERLTAAASETAAALEAALADRRAYLRELAEEERLNAAQIARLEEEAAEAQRRSQRIASAPQMLVAEPVAPAPAPAGPVTTPPPAPTLQPEGAATGARTLTVESTGYALPGTTASGLPVGWGIVAVDPSVIPMGTKMTIPGYGEGVAADTGSAVKGLKIDVWFPTVAQALEWGRRTVTITLHSG